MWKKNLDPTDTKLILSDERQFPTFFFYSKQITQHKDRLGRTSNVLLFKS